MKSSIVPAQITTVEDKVAGNLSLSQLLLLTFPVFTGGVVYIAVPPVMTAPLYKLVLMGILILSFGILAVRIKGKILLLWLITIASYNLRPRYHVFDKNDSYLRGSLGEVDTDVQTELVEDENVKLASPVPLLSTRETVLLEGIIASPKANLHFVTNRKGALDVRITQSK